MSFDIRGREIGCEASCYITFEAGPTHTGLDSAIEFVKLAHDAGADAIKFQIFNPDKLVADRSLPFSYKVLNNIETGETETITESLYEILKRRSLKNYEWREVKKIADECGIAFFATIGFEEDVEFLSEIGCESIKVASADVNHFPLLKLVAQTGISIQLDTGSSSIGEIEKAVDVIVKEGNEKIIIHQCPSGYPARLESINLNMIKTLKTMFPYPIAFSDHTPGWDMDIAAVALGANLIEKTITKNRMTRGVEHMMSIEKQQFKPFIQAIRDVEVALGGTRRVMTDEEINKRSAIRRSAHLTRDMKAGEVLGKSDIEFRRPGYGIPPSKLEHLIGSELRKSLSANKMLSWNNIVLR